MIKKDIFKNIDDLTTEFFYKHWPSSDISPPKWFHSWDFNGMIGNHNKRGCYALIENYQIVYIGVALNQGDGEKYLNCGLGYRLKRYWRLNHKDSERKTKYRPSDEWKNLTSISTIGFDKYYYLAAALEIYLIENLKPKRNFIHKRKST